MTSATPRLRSGLVIEPDKFEVFIRDLRELGRSTNLSNAQIASRSKRKGLSASDVSRLTGGAECLSEAKVLAFVEACDGNRDEWARRYRLVAAAFKQHREDLEREIIDKPYTELRPPLTPLRFNIGLKKRVNRARDGKKISQNQTARAALFSPQKASNNFRSNQIASADFTARMLRAAGADDEEIATWLRWRSDLDSPAESTDEPRRGAGRKGPIAGTTLAVALFLALGALFSSDTWVVDDSRTAAPPLVEITASAAPSVTRSPSSLPQATSPTKTPPAAATSTPQAITSGGSTSRASGPTPSPTSRGIRGTVVDPTGHGNYLSPGGWHEGEIIYVQCKIVDGDDKGAFRTDDGKTILPKYVKFEQFNPVIPPCKK